MEPQPFRSALASGAVSTTASGSTDVAAAPHEVTDGDFEGALDGLTHDPEEEPKDLDIHTPAAHGVKHSWLQRLVPGIEKLAVYENLGTYVAIGRGENPQKVWESMPIYVRIGMQALYHGRQQARLLGTSRMEAMLKAQSIKQGKAFDSPDTGFSHILSFIRTYQIDTSELLKPNIEDWRGSTFNDFFSRALRPGARPIANPDDPKTISSAADCRLTVFPTVDAAKKIWIKGKHFTLANLLQDEEEAKQFEGGSVAVFRLAPADYHRYHSPNDAVVGETKSIEGTYYTVNPCAVNEQWLDVFTANRRDVTYLTVPSPSSSSSENSIPVAFVQIGAMLVGSIVRTGAAQTGASVKRGDELGYFAYGGSTVIALYPPGTVEWDQDLRRNSEGRLETAVRVGEQIGRFV
ncbi:hypothetical protein JCM10213_003118 [Rhodosporidiobolus nylandii]